jgi:hypothetical protein
VKNLALATVFRNPTDGLAEKSYSTGAPNERCDI